MRGGVGRGEGLEELEGWRGGVGRDKGRSWKG